MGKIGNYIGALDLGTTSDRFIIFNRSGGIVGVGQKEHEQIFPQPGWVEHAPMEIWRNTGEVMRAALSRTGLTGTDIAAIGIANQRETTLVWDRRTGKPYMNAIAWQDIRTDALCRRLAQDGGQNRFRAKTGLPLSTYFAGPKLRWILDHMEQDSGVKLSSLRVDGGMVVNSLLMQFQADMLGVPVIRPRITETTGLGAASAAALAIGFVGSVDELKNNWMLDKTWRPQMTEEERTKRMKGWKKAVERTLNWIE